MSSSFLLIDLLLELGVLTKRPSDLDLPDDEICTISFLSQKGLLDESEALEKVSNRLGVDFVDLESVEICSKLQVDAYIDILNPDLCWKYKIVPLYEDQYEVFTAFIDPLDTDITKTVEFSLGKPIKVCLAKEKQITDLLSDYFPRSNKKYDNFENVESSSYVEVVGTAEPEQDLDQKEADTPPIVKLCNKILSDGVEYRASDIHIEPSQSGLDVRFRIDGVLSTVIQLPKRLQPYVISRLKLLGSMDIAERRRPQDGRMRIRVARQNVDIRVSSVPVAFGEKLVLRLLRSDSEDLKFSSLGMSKEFEGLLTSTLHKRGKILLVTGPTGSGKTTTLYTCLKYLTDGVSNIQTVEDPIEYRVPGINQIQVNEATDVTFLTALRSILRQDPDVIMIGEIRDGETAKTAFQAAQTGHFVLSTLHTNDAPSTIARLLDLGVPKFLLSSSLAGVLAQRLVRQLCPACKKPADAKYTISHYETIVQTGVPDIVDYLMMNKGCDKCSDTGYSGRVGIFSMFEVTSEISEKIYSGASLGDIVEEARGSGFQSLHQAAVKLLREGVTSLSEVRPYLTGKREQSLEKDEPQKRIEPQIESAAEVPEPPTVVIEIPEKADPVQAEPVAVADKFVEAASPAGSGRIKKQTVVLVEDDEGIRTLLSMLLQKEMYEVIEAENGMKGLEMVYEHNPTIVLCDLMMPVMDGKQFLVKMKSNQDTESIPIIILTAADQETNEVDLLNLGAEDFVSKASSSEIMLSRLRKALKT